MLYDVLDPAMVGFCLFREQALVGTHNVSHKFKDCANELILPSLAFIVLLRLAAAGEHVLRRRHCHFLAYHWCQLSSFANDEIDPCGDSSIVTKASSTTQVLTVWWLPVIATWGLSIVISGVATTTRLTFWMPNRNSRPIVATYLWRITR